MRYVLIWLKSARIQGIPARAPALCGRHNRAAGSFYWLLKQASPWLKPAATGRGLNTSSLGDLVVGFGTVGFSIVGVGVVSCVGRFRSRFCSRISNTARCAELGERQVSQQAMALGGEVPIRGDLYLYLEGRSWLLTSQYPTPLLLENKNAPMLFAANFGLRILF